MNFMKSRPPPEVRRVAADAAVARSSCAQKHNAKLSAHESDGRSAGEASGEAGVIAAAGVGSAFLLLTTAQEKLLEMVVSLQKQMQQLLEANR